MNSFNSITCNLLKKKKSGGGGGGVDIIYTKVSDYATVGTSGTIQNLTLGYLYAMCIDTNDNLYICNTTTSVISRINTTTNTFTYSFIPVLGQDICIDIHNNLYFTNYNNATVYKYDINGNSISSMNVGSALGIVVDPLFNIYVGSVTAGGTIRKYTSMTNNTGVTFVGGGSTTLATLATNGSTALTSVSLSQVSNLYINFKNYSTYPYLYISDSTGSVAYVNLTTNKIYPYLTGIPDAYGVVTDNANNAYVCSWGGQSIYKVTNGTKAIFAGGGTTNTGSDIALTSAKLKPLGIVIANNGTMYVTDNLNNSVRTIL